MVGIQIEDQEFPKKCGHTPFKRVVPLVDMVEKIKVACEARRNSQETLIIARTDARQIEGFEAPSSAASPFARPAPTSCSWKRSKARRKCARPASASRRR